MLLAPVKLLFVGRCKEQVRVSAVTLASFCGHSLLRRHTNGVEGLVTVRSGLHIHIFVLFLVFVRDLHLFDKERIVRQIIISAILHLLGCFLHPFG